MIAKRRFSRVAPRALSPPEMNAYCGESAQDNGDQSFVGDSISRIVRLSYAAVAFRSRLDNEDSVADHFLGFGECSVKQDRRPWYSINPLVPSGS